MKLKTFCTVNDTAIWTKNFSIEWKKIFANYISYRGIMFNIYKELKNWTPREVWYGIWASQMCMIIDIFLPWLLACILSITMKAIIQREGFHVRSILNPSFPVVVSPAIGCYLQFLGFTNDNSTILYLGGVFWTSLTNNSKIGTEDFVRYPMALARIRQCQMV